jgi:hypothetical protein
MLNMPRSLSKITLSSPERMLNGADGLPIAELTDAPHRIALKAMGGTQPLGREPLRK